MDLDLTTAYKLKQDFLYGIRSVKYEESSSWLDNWVSKAFDANIKEFIDLKSMFYNWKQKIIIFLFALMKENYIMVILKVLIIKLKQLKELSLDIKISLILEIGLCT